ncbi:hypothetical protein [Brevibacterium zhoupengii]|nr:hypothetical protein [Brevibacterium zhoupengii]
MSVSCRVTDTTRKGFIGLVEVARSVVPPRRRLTVGLKGEDSSLRAAMY